MLFGSLEMGLKFQVFVLCLSIQFFTIAATTNSRDAAALNSLKDIWKNFPPSWRGSDPCEDWVGIRCSNSRVISITLPSMKLSGPLSGDITTLSELQILDLSYNKDLTGSLPTTIGDLKNLTSLILVGCGLSGPIPDSIGHLSKLVYLSLNSNSFIGPIPRTIGNLAELYWLDLADNKLTGTIPVSSGKSPGLDMLVHTKHFHLGKNQLSGTIPEQLFSSNMVLIHVLFDSNSLTGTLPTSLGLVQTLEVVRFDRNQLNGPVPSNLNNLSNVNELFLSNNKITGSIPDLTGLNSLNYLDMSNNSFDPSDFPTWFSTLQSLTTWMMDKTQLQGQVPPEFFCLPHLQTVVMRNNQLNGSMNISNNHSNQLKLVDLTGNQISSIVPTTGADDIDFILQSNPLCEESGETKDFCIPEVEISTYSTPSNNCIPGPCSSAQISSPNCHCAYPYTGTLAFRAPPFSDLENFTYFTTLEEHMVRTFQSYQLPVDSISLSKPHKDSNEYLNLTLRVFPPYDKDSFNRTGVSSLGFVLSNQTYKPPHSYGPYIFMAEDYQHFAGESRSKKSTNIGIIIGAAAGGCILLLLLIFVGVYAHHQKKIAQKANKQNPFAHWDQTKSSGNIPQLKGARCFSFEEVNKYTNHFSEANVIGSGGYGKVYKGTLPTGELVAVKRAQQGSIQAGAESSWREPDTVKKARQNPNRREPDTVKKVIQNPNPGGTDMGLESVGDLPLKEILLKLDSKHTAIVACVNRGLRKSASEDSLWQKICKDELDLHSPVNLYGNSLPSFKETYQAWRESFNMYPWPLVIRVKRCCDRLKNWLTINLPEAKATLRKGASEADIQKLENILNVKLPLPTRILYRLCDGQECSANDSDSPVGLGLIGGYCFYDHSVNVYLLPLSQIITETREITGGLSFNSRSKYILVAASLTSNFKFFFLNCTNGQLYVGTRNFLPDGEMLPCVPKNLINLQNASSDQQQDAMLLWLEEHARRLENGIIKIRKEGNIRSINLFPEKPPLCSTAITNGVRVRASSVFIPEAAKLQRHSKKYLFAYSIRMSLMPEGCITGGMNFSSCQLHQRHWVIRANDVVVSDTNGEAVIGMFPLLRPGEEEFVYESRTPLPTSSGSVRGSFTFVPGRLTDPKGGPFEAEVAEFSLCRPDYIF